MRLPVQHYYELDPGLIKPLGGSAFALKVPRVSVSLLSAPWACSQCTSADRTCTQNIRRLGKRRWPDSCAHAPAQYSVRHLLTLRHGAQLLNVWVKPLVHVNVRLVEASTAAESAVIIEATNWSLHGSELIESLGLNRRFSLAFQVGGAARR
jgi:hypothetical protein